MTVKTENEQTIAFAEEIYNKQKQGFVNNFIEWINERIETAEIQYKAWEYMTLEESKQNLHSKFFSQK